MKGVASRVGLLALWIPLIVFWFMMDGPLAAIGFGVTFTHVLLCVPYILLKWDIPPGILPRLIIPAHIFAYAHFLGWWLTNGPAGRRAMAMLTAHLNEVQQGDLYNHQQFDVCGSNGRKYTVWHGVNGQTFVVNRSYGSRCIYPKGELPLGDKLLAIKLALEVDADAVDREAMLNGRAPP